MTKVVVLFWILLGTAITIAEVGRQPSGEEGVSPDEIRGAISYGRSTEPVPYTLRSIFPTNTQTVALVYTPFVRIALASREALKSGRPYDVGDVDPEDASPLIQVVMSADTVAPMGILTGDDPVRMELLAEPNHEWLGSPKSHKAAWVRHQTDRTIVTLPGSTHHGVVVGAFTRQQLAADGYVVSYRMRRTADGYREIRAAWAVIKKTDVETWR